MNLPEIFSQPQLRPNKIGGIYSLHLHSARYGPSSQSNLQSPYKKRALHRSLADKVDSPNLLMETRSTFRISQYTRRSFYEHNSVIQQKGFGADNINGRVSNQSQNEEISNFLKMKKEITQNIFFAMAGLQNVTKEQQVIRSQLLRIKQQTEVILQKFQIGVKEKLRTLYLQFRQGKRQFKQQYKAINEQLTHLIGQVQLQKELTNDFQDRFQKITQEFR